ncbi:MAG: GNAT family protein [Alphaproteobacteria bacterium]|nr:GNAT family protein [Alphaproteobacteria bacterium]
MLGRSLPNIHLWGERVMIRPPRNSDYLEWMKLRSTSAEFLRPWEPVWPPDALSRAAWRRFYQRVVSEWHDDRAYSFFIFHRHRDMMIGGINLNRVERGVAQRATLGYWIGEPFKRQGYMTEALRLAVQLGFGELHLQRLQAAFVPNNQGSRALLRRLGFVEEGRLRNYLQINGEWQDHVMTSLILEDLI